jgi:DNA (cytosine-5)-methyltransferase 1
MRDGAGSDAGNRDSQEGETFRIDGCLPRAGVASGQSGSPDRPAPSHGRWADADWILCTDGVIRPVEPGTFPLAAKIPNRVGLLRGYGNAIDVEVAAAFIEEFRETVRDMTSPRNE